MNARTLLLLLVAIAVALGMAFFVRGKLLTAKAPASDTVMVIAAVAEIPAGGFVRVEKHLGWMAWPRANVTPALLTEGHYTLEEFGGAVARRGLTRGEPVTVNTLVKSNEGGFMAAVLTPGARAVSISVTPTTGNAGFIFPGDRVDLILTHEIPVAASGENEMVLASETFVDNARVLAVDQQLDNPDNKAMLAKTVTIEVTPKQAEKINVATRLGQISLSLRSLGNAYSGAAETQTLSDAQEQPEISGAHADGSPEEDESYTRDSDVSHLLSGRGNVHSRVQVIRGSEFETRDFLRKAK